MGNRRGVETDKPGMGIRSSRISEGCRAVISGHGRSHRKILSQKEHKIIWSNVAKVT